MKYMKVHSFIYEIISSFNRGNILDKIFDR